MGDIDMGDAATNVLKLLIVETTSKRFTQYISNIQTIVYCFMLKNLLNPLAVKWYFACGSYKNCCYLRLRKTYIQQPRTLCVFLARVSIHWQYVGGLDCRSERVNYNIVFHFVFNYLLATQIFLNIYHLNKKKTTLESQITISRYSTQLKTIKKLLSRQKLIFSVHIKIRNLIL